MRARIDACRTKEECIQLVRTLGYGVPQVNRALASAQNDLALIAQAYIKPFKRERVIDADGRSQLKDPTFGMRFTTTRCHGQKPLLKDWTTMFVSK